MSHRGALGSAAQSEGRDPSSGSLISAPPPTTLRVTWQRSGTSSMAVRRVFSRPRNFMKTTQIESFSFTRGLSLKTLFSPNVDL